jgi:hypothetical protein
MLAAASAVHMYFQRVSPLVHTKLHHIRWQGINGETSCAKVHMIALQVSTLRDVCVGTAFNQPTAFDSFAGSTG